MKYTIEIGKIVEGALKNDIVKVKNFTEQLIVKLEEDGETTAVKKFKNMLLQTGDNSIGTMSLTRDQPIPVDMDSRTTLATVIYPNDINEDVVLSGNNLQKINDFILSYRNSDILHLKGLDAPNTLLLYGPPGCGKTKCAYKIAKELKLPLIIARLDSLISSYLGTTAKNIRTLFEYTQKMPCVLFLDEFDAIAKARDDNNELGELKRVVNSLLQNIDMMSKDSLLLAATNHDKLLDSAVWRRFDYKLEIELPDLKAIEKMLDIFIGKNLELSEKEKNSLSHVFLGLSGANIEEIVKKSLRNSIIYNNEFSLKSIYNEVFSFNHIYLKDSEKELVREKAKFLRKINEKIFSYQVIADIIGVGKTTVSSFFKEGE